MEVTRMYRFAAALLASLVASSLAGCGGGSHEGPQPSRPAVVSLVVRGDVDLEEAANAKVPLRVELDAFAAEPVTVHLDIAGTATSGSDYALAPRTVTIPASGSSATAEIDIYRDFDEEADETIEVALGAITGNAQAGQPASVTLTIRDAGPGSIEPAEYEAAALQVFPFGYTVTEFGVVLAVFAVNSLTSGETVSLVAEWSTDPRFQTDVRSLGEAEIDSDHHQLVFPNLHVFTVPAFELVPNEIYYVRARLGEVPSDGSGRGAPNIFFDGFATGADGAVVVRCNAPSRTASAGIDPLFTEQWHLLNTGQTAFSDRGGVPGADLRMSSTRAADLSGTGVKLAVVDSGLETCHPDLAANAAGRGSYNFAYDRMRAVGAVRDEPFRFGLFADHGTSVAGIAAAVADNGLGGRGVASAATLVGFNLSEAEVIGLGGEEPAVGFETALLLSLGGSDSAPDSASVDVFNMSFGAESPNENSREEFVRLLKMATAELRSGRGALYVKAAGNEFELCGRTHPLNQETGCIAANADPDHNLPWLIVVGGFNADDVKSSYSSAGASLWVVGPSGEDGVREPAIITTDQAGTHGGFSAFPRNRLSSEHPLNRDGDYTSAFSGTSAATPAVAGAVAVLLGFKPELTWRDVKHILASTARRVDPHIAEVRAAFAGTPYVAQPAWQSNAAGYAFHNWYGFGAVDLDAAIIMAATYAPDSLGPFVESAWFDAGIPEETPLAIPDADGAGATVAVEVADLPAGAVVEAVSLAISVDHPDAFELGVTLRSPAGTASVVNPPFNAVLDGLPGLQDWHLLSNAFYGESPNGTWSIQVVDLAADGTGGLTDINLRFYYGEH